MTKIEVIGWRHLPQQRLSHHFKRRKDMDTAVAACWLVSPVNKLKVADNNPKCGLCEIMLAYHGGEDWYGEES